MITSHRAETFSLFSRGHGGRCPCRFAFSRRYHDYHRDLQTFNRRFRHPNGCIRCSGGVVFVLGISNPLLRGAVLPPRVDSRDHCCSKWVSTRHVCVDGRCSRGAWARSLLVGRSTVWTKINQDTARTEPVNRVRAHSRRQRCFPSCLVSSSSLSQSLTREQNAH